MVATAKALRRGTTTLHFTRGELTCLPGLERLLRLLRKADANWSLATNARLFAVAANARTFANAGLSAAAVSLHGPCSVHEALTGTEGFAQTVAGIGNLVAAGVDVWVHVLVTELLLREDQPEEFARLIAELGVTEVVLRGHMDGSAPDEQSLPDLDACASWTSRFAAASGPFLHITTDGLPQGTGETGHLFYTPGRQLKDFNLTRCPYRRKERRLPCGHEGVILREERDYRLWKCRQVGVAGSVLLNAKLNHAQVWLAGRSGTRPLILSDECRTCPRLHECPACFEPDVRECPPPALEPASTARSQDRLGSVQNQADRTEVDDAPGWQGEKTRHIEDMARRNNAARWDAATAECTDLFLDRPLSVSCLVREVWLVAPGVELPRRPFPDDPVQMLRHHRTKGLVPLSYVLPSEVERRPFAAMLARGEEAGRFFAQHHEGVSLQVTESCMCRCVMCNIVGYFKRPLMPLPEILGTLEQCGLLGMRLADLFGGEVTLRKDLLPLIRFVRRLGMDCMFITTGYYITPAYVRHLKEAGLNRVVVSIDGSRPEIHDSIRQLPGIYNRAVRAMRCLAAEKSIETFASTVILSENLHDLPDLVRLSGRLGIRKHEFFLPITGPVSSTAPRWPDADEAALLFDEIIPAVEEAAKELGMTTDFRPEIRGWSMPRSEAISMVSSGNYNLHAGNPRSRCMAPGWNLFITVNGNVYPCDMPSVISKESALGNLGRGSLLEIVTSTAMQEFAARAGHYQACRMCVGRYEAMGRGEGP